MNRKTPSRAWINNVRSQTSRWARGIDPMPPHAEQVTLSPVAARCLGVEPQQVRVVKIPGDDPVYESIVDGVWSLDGQWLGGCIDPKADATR